MSDRENELFTEASAFIRRRHTDVTVYPETLLAPPKFPCTCIEQADDYVYTPGIDSADNENYTVLVYEVITYSNKTGGKKSECKAIMATVDEFFSRKGFIRTTRTPISLDDSTKYRIFARYEAVVSKQNKIFRR